MGDNNLKVNIALLKQLREKTQAGYALCKKALLEANNDIEQAAKILRAHNIAIAEKKGDNIAENLVNTIVVDEANNRAIILQASTQTDFVSANHDFQTWLKTIAKVILKAEAQNLASASNLTFNHDETIAASIKNKAATFGENIKLEKFDIITKNDDEVFGFYNHGGGVRSTIVVVEKNHHDDTTIAELSKKIAVQIVATTPEFIDASAISVAKKQEIYETAKMQVAALNKDHQKPQNVIDNIIAGKVKKALEELTLVDSELYDSPGKKVQDFLTENNLKVKKMLIYLTK